MDKSKTSKTGNCQNGNEASIRRLIASVEQTTKKGHIQIMVALQKGGPLFKFFVSKIY